MSTDLDLEALKELCEKASPGEWVATKARYSSDAGSYEGAFIAGVIDEIHDSEGGYHAPLTVADAAFIAAARSAVPALIAEVEQLRTRRDEASAALAEAANEEFRKGYEDCVIHAQRILASLDADHTDTKEQA